VVVLKAAVVWVLARLARLRDVRASQLAVGLGQVGEFSFVLVTLLITRDLIRPELYTAVLAAVVVSVVLSTTLVRLGGWRTSPLVG
jgi:Kef-type K+ transport system membrane component KefB